jgi:hypothetical protein
VWGCRLDWTDDGTFQETYWTIKYVTRYWVHLFLPRLSAHWHAPTVTHPSEYFTQQYHYNTGVKKKKKKSVSVSSSAILCVHSVETAGCTLCLSCYVSTCRPIVCHVSLFFLGAFAKLREATLSFVVSVGRQVCPSARNWAPTGRILTEFGIWVFFENIWRKFMFR